MKTHGYAFFASCTPVLVLRAMAGCSSASTDTPYAPTVSQYQFLTDYLEPESDVIWDSAGAIITVEGEVGLQPRTEEGWRKVVHAATVVAEGGHLLMMPGLAVDAADWNEYAQGLTRAALQAKRGARAQDADALFDAGGAIYNVCRACHNQYMAQDEFE